MTTDEAMQSNLSELEQLADRRHIVALHWTRFETIIAALCAIAPGGPLIVIPREHFKQLADRDCGAHCTMPLVHEQRHSDFCNKTRAMIAEGGV